MRQLALLGKSIRDAAHLAFACEYELEYLLTWNCTHIANAELRRQLIAINTTLGLQRPIICTTEELMGGRGRLSMYEEPIVKETRKAGQTLAERARGDVHIFFQHLRDAQQQYRERVVQAPRRPPQTEESGLRQRGTLSS
jgi:hypothetical protein